MGLSIALALVAALLFAVSAALQQHAARSTALGMQRAEAARRAQSARPPAAPSGPDAEAPGDVEFAGLDSQPAEVAGGRGSVALATGTTTATALTERPPDVPGRRPRIRLRIVVLLLRLLRNPWWLAGWLANVIGFGLHAVALHRGSIAVVQAVLVVQLLFALPLAAIPTASWPLRRDWVGMAAVCTGLISLLLIRGEIPQTTARRGAVPVVALVAGLLIVVLLVVAHLVREHVQTRTAAVAVAAGINISMTAVFLVFVTDDVAKHGLLATLVDWPMLGIVTSTVLGMVLVQEAFASGSLATALTATTITDPLTSWAAGSVLFDVRPPLHLATIAGGGLAGALVVIGVALLANSPTLHDERRASASLRE
jgi:hypothetical protein